MTKAMTSSNKSVSKIAKYFGRLPLTIIGGLLVLVFIVLGTMQLVLSPKFCTQLVNRYAPALVDGKFEMSSAHINVLRNFPRLTAEIDSVAVTYPSPVDPSRIDTLASFNSFVLSMNPLDLLLKSRLNVRTLVLEHARIKLEYYEDSTSNLRVLKFLQGDKEKQKDTSSFTLPEISIKRLSLDDLAHIDYINRGDSISLDVDRLNIHSHSDQLHIISDVRSHISTASLGDVSVPLSLEGSLRTYSDGNEHINLKLRDFTVKLATLPINVDMDVILADNIYLKGSVNVPDAGLQSLIDDYGDIVPQLKKLTTDAALSLNLDVDGYYDSKTGAIPAFEAALEIPSCKVEWSDFDIVPRVRLKARASAQQGSEAYARIDTLEIQAEGVDARLKCKINDLLDSDPTVIANVYVNAVLDTIGNYLKKNYDIFARGRFKAEINGQFHPSQLNLYKICDTDISADARLENFSLRSDRDSLDVFVDSLGLKAGMEEFKSKRAAKYNKRLLCVKAGIDSVYFKYKDAAHITGRRVSALMHSLPDVVKVSDSVKYNPVSIQILLGSFFLEGEDSLGVRLVDSRNTLSVHPSLRDKRIPVIQLTSLNDRIRAATGPNHFAFKNLKVSARAEMNQAQNRRRISTVVDSVTRSHPEWTSDSVARYISRHIRKTKLPDYLTEEDFRKADLKIDLGESFMKLFRRWTVSGRISLDRSFVKTPAFPLRTSLSHMKGSFTNDMLSLDSLKIRSGVSKLEARGSISNLKRALSSRGGTLKLDMNLQTERLSVNQLLDAWAKGQKNMQKNSDYVADADSEVSDPKFQMVDSLEVKEATQEELGIIVIPANLEADIKLNCRNIQYSTLNIDSFKADIVMRHRCLQLQRAKASSSLGNMNLDAFYSTKTKKDLLCGFDLNLNDISAHNIIELMPKVDTLMPVLKSFDGLLNCNVAATASFDEKMNIEPESIDGVVRISGKNIHFNENKQVKKIASMLLFKNPSRVSIDSMKVEGILKEGTLEIFPFLLKVDRWNLAMAGIQNLDGSFRYHVSFVKSPLLIKFGANITGDDFDHMKLKLGKAKYLNKNIPSFTQAIDDTRINLRTSIDKIFEQSVERAISQHEKMDAISNMRRKLDYQQSIVDEPLEKPDE